MKINVHNKDLELIGLLDNESQYTINYAEDKWTRTLATGSSVYEFTAYYKKLNYSDEYSNPFNNLKVGNYVSFKYNGEDFLFKIMSTEKNGKEVYCYCENLNLELRNELVGSFDSSDKLRTLEDYIKDMKLLEYTNMSLGINEVSQLSKKLSFTNDETKLARLLNLLSEFGAEHRFFTKLNPNGTIKEFKLDVFKKQNADGEGGYGKKVEDVILRKGVNVKSVKEKEEILNLWNATRPVGKKTITRVTQKKTPVKNKEQVVVSSNMVNANGSLSIENIQTILKLCYEYRLLPSGVISQLYLESFWGNSNVARVDNNWSGMTWTGNPNRPSGVVVSQGSARPSAESGHYMHFANMSDFFKDYFYLLAKQGIYNVANKNNISDYTRGLFRVGGAKYDYAAAGFDHYNSLMAGIRNGINAKNGNVLDTYDNDWNNPKVVETTTVVEQKGAPNTKRVLSELASMVGRTIGNGQCYGLTSWYSNKLGGAGLGAGIGGFSGLVGSGIRACDIGTDYRWGSFGWSVDGSGFSNSTIIAGTILNIKPNYGAPWYTGYYGHTVVVESVSGDTVTVLQQNYAGRQYVTRDNYSLSAIVPSIQTLVRPPELVSGGRVEGTGNVVVKEVDKDRYVNLDLPTDVTTTEETIDVYIDSQKTRYWYDKNNNLEFHLVNGALYADQSSQMFPTTFTSYDGTDKWIRRDFEYQVDSEEELIDVALADLKANCYPSLSYEIEGFFQTDIGNTHIIEDPDFEPMLTLRARVTEQEISFSNQENNKTTFANYAKLKSEVPDALTSRLQQLIDASIPYEIRVTASNGTSFKNNEGESELTVELLKSGITQKAEFFFKNGDSIIGKGEKLLVKATDFENVLNLTIEAYVNNSLVATKPLTFTDVEDGVQGAQGPQGPQGPQGADGKSSYTHIAYANIVFLCKENGSFTLTETSIVRYGSDSRWVYKELQAGNYTATNDLFGQDPASGAAKNVELVSVFSTSNSIDKTYIGMYVDNIELDSTDPSKYKWTLIKGADGPQGIPGAPGADGKTSYFHMAYATSADGKTGFSFTESGQQYQGYYTDFTQASSTEPTKYTWMDRRAGVEVGFRNLLIQTNKGKTNWGWNTSNDGTNVEDYNVDGINAVKLTRTSDGSASWSYIQYQGLLRNLIEPNTQYTLSFDIYPSQDVTFTATLMRGDYTAPLTNSAAMNKAMANQWNKLSCVLTSVSTFPDDLGQVVYLGGMPTAKDNYLIIKNIKMEKGNIPTPWIPALEDTQADIDNKADQTLTQSQLNALAEKNNLIKAEMEAKASISTVNQWISAYQNYVKANDADKTKSEQALQDASSRLLQLNTDVGALKQQWNFIDTYMTVQNEGLIIGKSDGSAYAKFSDDRISLFSGSSEVMYISQGTLNIANGIFTKTIQIGRFRFETHPADADMLVVRFLGG